MSLPTPEQIQPDPMRTLPAEFYLSPNILNLEKKMLAGTITGEEDQVLCESVQRGMHQQAFQQGWYITDPDAHNVSEHALQYFHELYLDAMGGE